MHSYIQSSIYIHISIYNANVLTFNHIRAYMHKCKLINIHLNIYENIRDYKH